VALDFASRIPPSEIPGAPDVPGRNVDYLKNNDRERSGLKPEKSYPRQLALKITQEVVNRYDPAL